MPLNPAGVVASDHLSVAGEPVRLDFKIGFLADLARHGFHERLTKFDTAARKGIEAVGGRLGPTNDQHAAVPEDGGADRKIGPRWKSSCFGTVARQSSIHLAIISDPLPPMC